MNWENKRMKVQGKKYVIATRDYPILFDCNGEQVDDFGDVTLYGSEEDAREQLSHFDDDCKDEWCVISVNITYNF